MLTDVTPEMDAYREEIFGPVVLVFRAETEEEAIAIANDSPFGLGASVFGTDPERNRRVADQIEAGMVYMNTCRRLAGRPAVRRHQAVRHRPRAGRRPASRSS